MKRRVPHLYLEPPWTGLAIPLPEETSARVTYTDGKGVTGVGLLATGPVQRGEETCVAAAGAAVTIAVAPPNDRVRLPVERLGESGVERLVWLRTRYGTTQPLRVVKLRSWPVAAFEQSVGVSG